MAEMALPLPAAAAGGERPAGRMAAIAMVAPAAVLLLVLLVVPLLSVVAIAFTDWQMGSRRLAFVGWRNFAELISDRQFLLAFGNTAVYVALVAPISVAAGLVVALLIGSVRRFQAFYRTVFFLPTIATLAAAVVAWQMLLHPGSGLFNQVLRMAGIEGPNWLKDPDWALPTIALIGIWERVGFNAIFFLAALRDLPQALLDAAALEGADRWLERFWLVIWPHLGPIALFLVVIASIHAFQAFEAVAILTQGGPQRSTQLLLYTIYQEGFVFFRTSYAATVTLAYLAVLAAFSALQFFWLGRRVHYA